MRSFSFICLLATAVGSPAVGHAEDWIVAPSYFTHDPSNGQRVTQYTPIGPFYTYPRGDFRSSGFRHYRSSLAFGGTADHYHQVQEWGRPIRPYGEWKFPYRPYSVPRQLWGAPYEGMYRFYFPGRNPPVGGGPGGPIFPGYPGGGYPGGGYPGGGYPGGGYPGGGYPGGGYPGGGYPGGFGAGPGAGPMP